MAAVQRDSEDEQYFSAESDSEGAPAAHRNCQSAHPTKSQTTAAVDPQSQTTEENLFTTEDILIGENATQSSAVTTSSDQPKSTVELDTQTRPMQEEAFQPQESPNAENGTASAATAEGEDLESDGEENLNAEEVEERKSKAQALKEEGNVAFKAGDSEEALARYTSAIAVCPRCCSSLRAVVYANAAACLVRLDKHEEVVKKCAKALKYDEHYIKALLRRAASLERLERLEEALKDYHRVLELDQRNAVALQAAMRLPDEIKQQQEKLKAEMLGKLKDLGNVFLKPFGLSTDNFRLQQDPKTGGYSVNFTQ